MNIALGILDTFQRRSEVIRNLKGIIPADHYQKGQGGTKNAGNPPNHFKVQNEI